MARVKFLTFASYAFLIAGIALILEGDGSITGAFAGAPAPSFQMFLGIFFLFLSVVSGGLETRIANEAHTLLKQRRIPTHMRDLVRVAEHMGYSVEEGGKHIAVFDYHAGGRRLITAIPRHTDVKRYTAQGILQKLDRHYASHAA